MVVILVQNAIARSRRFYSLHGETFATLECNVTKVSFRTILPEIEKAIRNRLRPRFRPTKREAGPENHRSRTRG